jgi:hypothetical protein
MSDLLSLAAVPELAPVPTPWHASCRACVAAFGCVASASMPATTRAPLPTSKGGIDGVTAGHLGGNEAIVGLLGGYVHSDLDLDPFADGDSLRSRAGLRAGYLGGAAGALIEPYVEGNFLHEFAGDVTIAVSFMYPSAGNALGSCGLVGGGVQAIAAQFTAFANLQSFIGGAIDSFAGQGGLRVDLLESGPLKLFGNYRGPDFNQCGGASRRRIFLRTSRDTSPNLSQTHPQSSFSVGGFWSSGQVSTRSLNACWILTRFTLGCGFLWRLPSVKDSITSDRATRIWSNCSADL